MKILLNDPTGRVATVSAVDLDGKGSWSPNSRTFGPEPTDARVPVTRVGKGPLAVANIEGLVRPDCEPGFVVVALDAAGEFVADVLVIQPSALPGPVVTARVISYAKG